PTTGSTGAPQPTTLHGPVDSPSTPASALTVPPARPAAHRPPPPPPAPRATGSPAAAAPAAPPHGAPFEPERDVETDEQRRDDESHDVGAVHRETPLRLAIRRAGGEQEERDPRQEVELVRPRGGGGEVLGQPLEPWVEGEVRPRRPRHGKQQRWEEHVEGEH